MYSVNRAANHHAIRRARLRMIDASPIRLSIADCAFNLAARLQTFRIHRPDCGRPILDRVAGLRRYGEGRGNHATNPFNCSPAPAEGLSVLVDRSGGGAGNDSGTKTAGLVVRHASGRKQARQASWW